MIFRDKSTLFVSKPKKYRVYIFLLSFVCITFNPFGVHMRSLEQLSRKVETGFRD